LNERRLQVEHSASKYALPCLRKTSSETTISRPNCLPTNSGNCDGNLFGGTQPEGLPTFFGPDPMIGSCCKSGIADHLLFATANNAVVFYKFTAVPQAHCSGDGFYCDETMIRQDQFTFGDTILLPWS
jgi:hypothetical protein